MLYPRSPQQPETIRQPKYSEVYLSLLKLMKSLKFLKSLKFS
jgi:hypothetical protein